MILLEVFVTGSAINRRRASQTCSGAFEIFNQGKKFRFKVFKAHLGNLTKKNFQPIFGHYLGLTCSDQKRRLPIYNHNLNFENTRNTVYENRVPITKLLLQTNAFCDIFWGNFRKLSTKNTTKLESSSNRYVFLLS